MGSTFKARGVFSEVHIPIATGRTTSFKTLSHIENEETPLYQYGHKVYRCSIEQSSHTVHMHYTEIFFIGKGRARWRSKYGHEEPRDRRKG